MQLMDRKEYYRILTTIYIYFSEQNFNLESLEETNKLCQIINDNLTNYFEHKLTEITNDTTTYYSWYIKNYNHILHYTRKIAKTDKIIIKRILQYCDKCFFYLSKGYYGDLFGYTKAIGLMVYNFKEKFRNDTVSK